MKAKLLRKIKSRMLSITFCDESIEVEYVNSCGELHSYKLYMSEGSVHDWSVFNLIEAMFGERYMKRVEKYREKSLSRRNEAKLTGKIRYGWK